MSLEALWNGVTLETPEGLFPLGTDAILLADFVSGGKRICDLCCGSGAVALMLLASDRNRRVTGVELQPEAAEAAKENAERNGVAFSVLEGDVREIRSLLPPCSFDAVTANPPYHRGGDDPARAELCCTPEDLCAAAGWLLPTGGRFYLIHRTERLADLICALRASGLEPKRLQLIRHHAGSRRVLFRMEAVRGGNSALTLMEDLILYNDDGSETEDCRRAYHRGGD